MKIRGQRQCKDCGTEWSYYETGSLECPNCESIHSRGLDQTRSRHTDAPITLDVDTIRSTLANQPIADAAREIATLARQYTTARGFIHAGDLQPLDEQYRLAVELRTVADTLHRALDPSETAEEYLLQLITALEENIPPPQVFSSLQSAHGLAAASAVQAYRRDLVTWLDEHPQDPNIRRSVGRIRAHERRILALDGAVPPATADTLVAAVRDIESAIHGDEAALTRAMNRLDRLDDNEH